MARLRNKDTEVLIDNPASYPDEGEIREMLEPMVKGTLIIPEQYLGRCVFITVIYSSLFLFFRTISLQYLYPLTLILYSLQAQGSPIIQTHTHTYIYTHIYIYI